MYVSETMIFRGAIGNLSQFLRYIEFSQFCFIVHQDRIKWGKNFKIGETTHILRKITWQVIKTKALEVLLVFLVKAF